MEAVLMNGNGALPMAIPVEAQALTPMEMLGRAVAEGAGIETLTKLMELEERWEKNRARKAFNNALADAKAEIPVITKNRHVGFQSKKEGAARTDYWHEDLAEIARTIDPILSRHGLLYRWRPHNGPNEPVTVTCIVSHRDGHFEETTLSGAPDSTGNKNSHQAIASAVTLLERYTLKAALGLAASNDDDGRAAGPGATVSDQQAAEILRLVQATKSNIDLFLKWAGAPSIPDIPAAKYETAIKLLNSKMRGRS
jgi:hypothetical protein